MPGLASKPFWYAGDAAELEADPRLAWISEFEASFEDIRDEVLALRRLALDEGSSGGFQQYRAPSWSSSTTPSADGSSATLGHDRGDWNVYYLHLHSADFGDNLARCPRTAAAIDKIPFQYKHCFFSALAPGTHIPAHTGPANKKLRLHLPLVVPPGDAARIRVGPRTEPFREGKCLLFDDSFEHEAWNDAATPRIVLIVDLWHPDLSPAEVKFLTFLVNGRLRLAKRLGAAAGLSAGEDFFGILEKARKDGADLNAIFGDLDDAEEPSGADGK